MHNQRTGSMSRATGRKRADTDGSFTPTPMHMRSKTRAERKTKTQRKLAASNKKLEEKNHAYMAGSGLLKKSIIQSTVNSVKKMFRRTQGK